jgi:Na+/proline symporter
MNLDVDVAIVIGFFVVTLFIALQHGGGIKTINEYALGDRKFSTATLVSTIVATWISGSLFFTDLSKTYSDGLLYIIPSFCMPFSLLITAYVFVPRMGEFLGKLSVAEVMGSLYGKEVRLITAICGIIGNIGGLAIQFKVFGTLFHYFLGIPEEYALFLASALVTAYSAFGGIKSVTYTDIIQFFTFSFVIPVIGIIVWNHFTSLDLSLANAFQNSIFSFREVLNVDNPRFWEMVFLAFYFAVPAIGAMDFQRISMARNIAQIKLALIISTVLVIFISLSISWIPFLVFNIDQSINPNELFAYLVDNYSYTGFKGFMIIGIAAMAMSTADSRINAVSVLAAHDLGKVIDIKVNSLIVSKISSVLFGLFAVYLALSENDLLAIIMMSASFYMPIITVPLTLSILGFRSTKQVVLIGMGAAFISVILWDYLGTGIHKIIPSMIVNLFFIFSSHYLFKQKGGWVGIKDKSYLDEARKHRKQHRGVIMSDIRNFNIFKFCLANSPKMDVMYSFLAYSALYQP